MESSIKCLLSFNDRELVLKHIFHLRNTAPNTLIRCKIVWLLCKNVQMNYRYLELSLIQTILRKCTCYYSNSRGTNRTSWVRQWSMALYHGAEVSLQPWVQSQPVSQLVVTRRPLRRRHTVGTVLSGLGRVWSAKISLSIVSCSSDSMWWPVAWKLTSVVSRTMFPLTLWCGWLPG
jgi:hypothetical protein